MFILVAYCNEKSSDFTTMFLEKVLVPFLKQFKYLDFRNIIIQTDNGMEFTNKYIRTKDGHEAKDSSFTIFIAKRFKKHRTNIPGHCTQNSEVESFHWDIERDCLAWDDIYNNKSLLNCVDNYINTYVHTKISTRGFSPYQKIKETLKVKSFKVPKAKLLTYRDKQY
ncbi:MAG: transposase family protein [Bacilli bacterium]|nr:transposase family protein [Bacilli bacterium]